VKEDRVVKPLQRVERVEAAAGRAAVFEKRAERRGRVALSALASVRERPVEEEVPASARRVTAEAPRHAGAKRANRSERGG